MLFAPAEREIASPPAMPKAMSARHRSGQRCAGSLKPLAGLRRERAFDHTRGGLQSAPPGPNRSNFFLTALQIGQLAVGLTVVTNPQIWQVYTSGGIPSVSDW